MLVSNNNFIPVVFPPGAGGHFFWQLLSIHPNVMPMGKDQTMQKLFLYKGVREQSNRVIKSITSNHNDWQKIESHDYYLAPPDYSQQEQAEWTIDNNIINIHTGDHYFFEKIHKENNVYSMVVHNVEQFPKLNSIDKCIVFENYDKHIQNSKNKIKHLDNKIYYKKFTRNNSFVIDVDRFYYDWTYASVELYLLFDYFNLWLGPTVRLAIEQSWNAYRSIH